MRAVFSHPTCEGCLSSYRCQPVQSRDTVVYLGSQHTRKGLNALLILGIDIRLKESGSPFFFFGSLSQIAKFFL